MVLLMTVEPGFGGQAFMPDVMKKVASANLLHTLTRIVFVYQYAGFPIHTPIFTTRDKHVRSICCVFDQDKKDT